MNAVFLKLLNMSLTASLLILAVLPVRLLMKKAPKWMTCLLWLIVAVALICPVRFESPVSVLPVADPIVITSDKPQTNDTLPLYQEEPILIQDIVEQDNSPTKPDYLKIGSTVWCIGMAALLGCAIFSWLRLKRRVAVSIEIGKNVYLCDDIDTPFILGIIRPHIYLPSTLDEATAQQVLVHERAHLARKDHWWKPLGYLLLTLHWFNPLVWAAYSLLCTDIELACDEKVIKDMDTVSKQAYSEALLSCSIPRHLIAACPLAFGEVSVKQRISAVLHYKKPTFWVIVLAIVVCIALCFGFLTEPEVVTLKELGEQNNLTREGIDISYVHLSGNYVLHSDNEQATITNKSDISDLCDLLAELEVHPTKLTEQPLDHVIAICSSSPDYTWFLNFNEDYSYLWIYRNIHFTNTAFTPGEQDIWITGSYEVLNPEVLQNANPEATDSISEDSTSLPSEELKSAVENSLSGESIDYSKADLTEDFYNSTTFYCTATMNYTTADGTVRQNYPITVIFSYADKAFTADVFAPEEDVATFQLTDEPVFMRVSPGANPRSEARLWVSMNPETGEILSVVSHPAEQQSNIPLDTNVPLYIDMDDSFRGYEALYHAIKTDTKADLSNYGGLTLAGHQSYKGYEYAVIRQKSNPADICALLEYVVNEDGTVTLLNYDQGSAPESMGKFGYSMNYATMNGGSMYWTLFTDERWATTKDGKEADNTKTVPTDYTGFRFIWPDLHQVDYPAENGFFLTNTNSVIPPSISIPMVGDTAVTALGFNLPG